MEEFPLVCDTQIHVLFSRNRELMIPTPFLIRIIMNICSFYFPKDICPSSEKKPTSNSVDRHHDNSSRGIIQYTWIKHKI